MSDDTPPTDNDIERNELPSTEKETPDVEPSSKEVEKYSPSCYWMIANSKGHGLWYGMFVIALQMTLLWFLKEGFQLIRGGEQYTTFALATQALAGMGFFLFAEHALGEIYESFQLIPNPFNPQQIKNNKMLLLSSLLKMAQGGNAAITCMDLITTRDSPYTIVLSITAVETIARFDVIAFRMARSGIHGKRLQIDANKVVDKNIPEFARASSKSARYRKIWFNIYQAALFCGFLGSFIPNIIYEEKIEGPPVLSLRVQFPRSSGLNMYSGCFVLPSMEATAYHHNISNSTTVGLGHCNDDSRWIFYFTNSTNSNVNNETATTAMVDPCDTGMQIAQSGKTTSDNGVPLDYGDLSFFSETPWYTPPDQEPFDAFFMRIQQGDEFCDSPMSVIDE